MGLSFRCQKPHFSTTLEKYRKSPSLFISTVGFASILNWSRDNQSTNEFITLFLNDKSILETLHKQLSSSVENIGLFVSLSADNKVGESLTFGLMTPTSEEKIWCIKLLAKNPEKNTILYKDAPFRICPMYPKKDEFKSLLLAIPSSLASPLIIPDSYDQLLRSANELEDKTFDMSQLDLGIENTCNNIPTITTTSSKKVLKTIDPIEYLTDRYFTTLYSASMSIEHFVKSSIPKMHLLRRDNVKLAKDCLSKLIIETLSDFDRRHNIQIEQGDSFKLDDFRTIWLSKEKLLDETEEDYRLEYLLRSGLTENGGLLDPDKLNAIMDRIKLNDLKLQLLLDLEFLKMLKFENEGEKSVSSDKKNDQVNGVLKKDKRPPLLAKRYSSNLVGKKKRLIPTLLGTVIPTSLEFDVDLRLDQEDGRKKLLTIEGTEKLIKILFDKLCVYDAIMGLDYKDINSSWGFLSNCVIPFYEKNHRRLLKTLAIKSRGPAFSLKMKSRHEKRQRQEKRKEKLVKAKESTRQGSMERKPASIDLSKIKLKRSHSSFGSSKADLSRKTISMVKSTTDLGPIDDFMHMNDLICSGDSINSVSDAKGFMNSKKRKLYAPKRKEVKLEPAKSVSSKDPETLSKEIRDFRDIQSELFHPNQVIEATPRKASAAKSTSGIGERLSISSPYGEIYSPNGEQSVLSGYGGCRVLNNLATTEISGTPAIERVQIRPGVFEIGSSPLKSGALSQSNGIKENIHLVVDTPLRKKEVVFSSPSKLLVPTPKTPMKSTKRKLDFS